MFETFAVLGLMLGLVLCLISFTYLLYAGLEYIIDKVWEQI